MFYNILTPFLYLFILASFISQTPVFAAESVDRILFRLRFKVHILNGFADNANPLIIHCYSLDDDLGQHTLWKGQEFQFKFGLNLFRSTYFECTFKWGSKSTDPFSVFTGNIESITCKATGNCFWKVTEYGIYFSNNNKDWEKRLGW
ncbi:hypothetical protein PTKIN_Ptkin17bG0084900 [Pterospermum kingtungense]